VLVEAEDTALVEADALEDTVSVEETVVKDRDFGFGLRIKLSVDIDFHRYKKPPWAFFGRFSSQKR
jgi:hypothetical protein